MNDTLKTIAHSRVRRDVAHMREAIKDIAAQRLDNAVVAAGKDAIEDALHAIHQERIEIAIECLERAKLALMQHSSIRTPTTET